MFNNKVIDYLDLSRKQGSFGVEIEMELNNFLDTPAVDELYQSGWNVCNDGSLRGPSCELVMRTPKSLTETHNMVSDVSHILNRHDLHITPSIRAGVHIHMNMQRSTIGEMFKFLLAYYPLETVLLRQCGFGRQGNLFCLRGRDAEYVFEALENAVEGENLYDLRTDSLRYSAMNIQSLFKFGSVEFRALATTPSLDNITKWCSIMQKLKDYSSKTATSWDVIGNISGDGPENYVRNVLGEDLASEFIYDGMAEDIMKDVRNVQRLAFLLTSKGL